MRKSEAKFGEAEVVLEGLFEHDVASIALETVAKSRRKNDLPYRKEQYEEVGSRVYQNFKSSLILASNPAYSEATDADINYNLEAGRVIASALIAYAYLYSKPSDESELDRLHKTFASSMIAEYHSSQAAAAS